MTTLANVIVEKVWEGKSGESAYGPWTGWNFTVEGHEEKFGYFSGPGKTIPREGMSLEVLSYTTKQNGEYTNHTVKKLQTGQSATPPTKARQDAPTALKQAPVLRRDTKSITIGMYACVKAAGSLDHKNVDELISDATHIFKAVALFAETYRPDLDKIGQKMVEHEVPPDFWDWLINANKVSTKMDLSAVATQYTLDNWATVVARYINDAERAEQDEDVIREQELDEKLFSTKVEMPPDHFDGPDGTNYPKQHQERCPEPVQAQILPF